MTREQEEKMIKAAHKYWTDESGSYSKEDVMVDAFVEGYKQAFALYNVSQQRELLLDFLDNIGRHDYETKPFKQIVSEYLKSNNCG